MRLLLDTHVLLWWLADDRRLKSPERDAIAAAESTIYVSAATIWEIAIKTELGRLDVDTEALERELTSGGLLELPVRWAHARTAGALPNHHGDPFDRLLLAQAKTEALTLVSYDVRFREYGLPLLPAR